jgi:hypothetical protein
MVDERLTDGTRIAQLLASEITGHGDALASVRVAEATSDVEPTPDGAFAYAIVQDDRRLGEAYVHPDRVRLELLVGQERAANAASARRLRVRPKAVRPPRTLVFVESGAAVKRVVGVLEAVASE